MRCTAEGRTYVTSRLSCGDLAKRLSQRTSMKTTPTNNLNLHGARPVQTDHIAPLRPNYMLRTSVALQMIVLIVFLGTPDGVQGQDSRMDSVIDLFKQWRFDDAYHEYFMIPSKEINPIQKLLVATLAHNYGDTANYLKIMLDLMANHGYENDDTAIGYPFYQDLTSEGRHGLWYKEKIDSCRANFLTTHIDRLEVIQKMKYIHAVDQLRGTISSIVVNPAMADSIIYKLDEANLYEILRLSKMYGMPNSYDDAYDTEGIVGLVLLHCGYYPAGFQRRWDNVFKYLNAAYDAGKIGNGFISLYDLGVNWHTGKQYFGTMPDVPVEDVEGLNERRARYNLSPE